MQSIIKLKKVLREQQNNLENNVNEETRLVPLYICKLFNHKSIQGMHKKNFKEWLVNSRQKRGEPISVVQILKDRTSNSLTSPGMEGKVPGTGS